MNFFQKFSQNTNNNNNNRGSTQQLVTNGIIYQTWSMCPQCLLLDRKGPQWYPAQVIAKDDKVFLVRNCTIHEKSEKLYCSNLEFFHKTLQFDHNMTLSSQMIGDMEDHFKKLQLKQQDMNQPLTLELSVWDDNAFVEDSELKKKITYYKSLYPADKSFILKIVGKLVMDIEKFNQKILFVESLLSGSFIVVEATYERLGLLCAEPDSCFRKSNIYPALKYYINEGSEGQCRQELEHLFESLKNYKGIQCMVTLCVEPPFPKINEILSFIRSQHGFIRVLTISLERSPREILKEVQNKDPDTQSEDIYQLLQHIETSTGANIKVDDFYPASVGEVLEPFIQMMGYGSFRFRPSPFCGFMTCLVNTKRLYYSYPVTRLFNFSKLYVEMLPHLPSLKSGKLSLFSAPKIKKIFDNCVFPNKGPLPDLFDLVTNPKKASQTRTFVENLQFIIVHNNMDFTSYDLKRRCNCQAATLLGQSNNQSQNSPSVFSYCGGCIL